jgi:hypothetical protein
VNARRGWSQKYTPCNAAFLQEGHRHGNARVPLGSEQGAGCAGIPELLVLAAVEHALFLGLGRTVYTHLIRLYTL